MDQRRLVVTPEKSVVSLPKKLAGLDVTLRANGDMAITFESKTRITALIEQIKDAGVAIADLKTEQADLEDVFMALTYDRDGHVEET